LAVRSQIALLTTAVLVIASCGSESAPADAGSDAAKPDAAIADTGLDCSRVGCAAPPTCGQPCTAPCGCCVDPGCTTDAGKDALSD
jgi:hypothetical protein